MYDLTIAVAGDPPVAVSITDTGTSGDVFTLTRPALMFARVGLGKNLTAGPAVGARISFDPGGTVVWDMVNPRTGGGAHLAGGTKTLKLKKSHIDGAYNNDTPATRAASAGTKMSSNAVMSQDSDIIGTTRNTALVAVGGGTVVLANSGGLGMSQPFTSVGDGDYSLSPGTPVIFSAVLDRRIYYVDGVNSKYYDHGVTDDGVRGSMNSWDVEKYDAYEVDAYGLVTATAGKPKGLFPVDSQGNKPRLIETWNRRIVLSGVLDEPQNYYMSRRRNPLDFDYIVEPPDDQRAGAQSIPDKINAIIPFSDDILLFGCDHSIHQLSGDPALGGVVDLVSDVTGVAWGRAWCKDPLGVLYFFGSRGGVYKFVPGSPPLKITNTTIDERLVSINFRENLIRMLWNDREQGVHVFVSPIDSATTHEHYFYDSRAEAWWIDEFEATKAAVADVSPQVYVHNTMAPFVLDGDDPNDRVVLIGGRDGALYKWDISSTNDFQLTNSSAIDSYVFMGPLNRRDGSKVVLSELLGILAANSSNVDYDVYVGKTAEEIISAIGTADEAKMQRFTGEFVSGRDRVDRRRAVAGDIFLKLRNGAAGENWALEKGIATVGSAGGRTNRTFTTGKKA